MVRKPALSRRALFAIFTLSGFSGLIYESIWSHYLKLFLGHAAYAQTLVLAIFMGGMALGSWLIARSAARLRNLLVAYAIVEAITGLIALLFHSLYGGATQFALEVAFPALGNPWAITAFKWMLGALLILPQSVLLGTTFPLISGGVIRRFPERSGETLAMLYFTNCLGAALGVLASGFYLIGKVGLPGAVMTAGILNIVLGLFVWTLARGQEAESKPAAPANANSATGQAVKWICLAAFLAGLAAFVYEIAWIRMLSLVLGSSTHGFELMLSAFILGLAIGGYWVRRRIDGYPHPPRTLATMFAIMALLAVLTIPAYGYAFDIMSTALRTFTPTESGYVAFNLVSHAIAAAFMLPTTIVAGMTLPLMTHYLLRQGAGESAIGKVYAANTVGAIVGVLLAIHLLLPLVTTKGAVVVGAIVQLGIALLLFKRSPAQGSLARIAMLAGALVVFAVGIGAQLDPMRMASGVYRRGQARLPDDSKVIFLRDGKTATITLAKRGDVVVIATNGKPDAAINMGEGGAGPDEITMTMAGALPVLMHPAPRRVANIGIGSGLTSQVVLSSDKVEVLDSIEIERAIVEAARAGFEPRVPKLFHDPRSRIHIEDAKSYFAATREPYDIIISEPSNPWVSGVATLFSHEFYTQIKRHLAPNGLLVQWVQVYETDVTVVASIIKALSPHFADYVVYNTDDSNLLIIASLTPGMPTVPPGLRFEGEMAVELERAGLVSGTDVALRRVGSKRLLDPLIQSIEAPSNSDYFPYVDLTAPKARFLQREALALGGINLRAIPVPQLLGEPDWGNASDLSALEGYYEKQRLADQALRIRGAIQANDPNGLSLEIASHTIAVGVPEATCAHAAMRVIWLNSVKSLSHLTTPYLGSGERESLWQIIRQKPCYTLATGLEVNMLQFLEAVSSRDLNGITSNGKILLRNPALLTEEDRVSVVLAVMTASLAGGDESGALAVLRAHYPLIEQRHDTDLTLRTVEAHIVNRLKQGSAGAGAIRDK